MRLSILLEAIFPIGVTEPGSSAITAAGVVARTDPDIEAIHYRAQEVIPGGLFVAISGHAADGHDFIDMALDRGAAVIVCERPVRAAGEAVVVEVENSRTALAALAAQFYHQPSEKLTLVGITGTNGKTTTSYLIERILTEAGLPVGVIGTINYRFSGTVYDNPVTTPESLDLQQILARMQAERVSHVVLEVSSHALDLHRVDACWIDVGVFTNLTQDHLDYHKDMETYWACKKKLFTDVLCAGPKKQRAIAVINRDDPRGEELAQIQPLKKITFGRSSDNTVWPEKSHHDQSGISGRISTPGGAFEFRSTLVGEHNQENILCAAGVGLALNIPSKQIKAGIENVTRIPGRLEAIPNHRGRFVYVDYAHTPDALKNVISALGKIAEKKMICVFGCGGDRDKDKRPLMGGIAASLCDLSIVTSDNPRSEPPFEIIDQILMGVRQMCKKQLQPSEVLNGFDQKGFVVEPDRKKAIQLAIAASRSGDTVLIAGKGHETYQILGDKTIAFDDREEAEVALAANMTGEKNISNNTSL